MSYRFDHRLLPGLRQVALSATLAALACALTPVVEVNAAQRSREQVARSSGSRYPAGATKPSRIAKASEFARSAAAHVAGSSKSSAKKKAKPKPKPVLRGNPARALIAFEAMQNAYYIRGSGLYKGEPFSFLWPFSQALAATVTMAHVKGVGKIPGLSATISRELRARLIGLRSYLDTSNSGAPEGSFTSSLAAFDGTVAPPVGPGGTKYYDDNEWVGIELMRLYALTGNASALGSAEAIMAFVMAGWDSDPELACPGGVPFSNSIENTDRNTVTDGPGAELAMQLYRVTHNIQYLQFAELAYNWVRACLLQPGELYADHIRAQGQVDKTLWSYNQGSMIGAGVMLYQATRNSGYLYQARQTAKAALSYYTPERLAQENPFFVSVYFRNMLYLDSVTRDPPGSKLVQPYVDYAWAHQRLVSNLFVAGTPPSAQLLVQAAIAQIYGLLSSPPSTYF